MNITIIGASAGIGLEAVKRGLSRSHSIKTLSRSEIGIQEKNKLNRVLGSATHKADLLKSIQNADAILITLGTSKDMKVTTLFSDFAKSLVATYDIYCHSRGFLDNIALGYGITFANDFLNLTSGVTYPRRKKTNESMPSLQVLKLKRKKFDLGSTTRKLF